MKHNKKRNTALVYESLVKEITAAIIKNDYKRKTVAVSLVKKHFKPGSHLRRHLDCYKSLYENQDLPIGTCEKIIKEANIAARLIDPHGLFKQQTELINDINKQLDPTVFDNFVPNYKTLATIDQIFNDKTTPKTKVMLESKIIENMSKSVKPEDNVDIDKLTLTTFIDKFNKKYSDELLDEQKQLLNFYITSFMDNAVELKMFLNEELTRLKAEIDAIPENRLDGRRNLINEKLNSFQATEIDDNKLLTILKTQQLVKELNSGSDY
jgi:hypothetical protein|tara:strand:- start:99 stop:899 length:801 start_codon:yes stop_codon:yes gene_type:complete